MASPNLIDGSRIMTPKKKKFIKEAVKESIKDNASKKKPRGSNEVRSKLYGSKE